MGRHAARRVRRLSRGLGPRPAAVAAAVLGAGLLGSLGIAGPVNAAQPAPIPPPEPLPALVEGTPCTVAARACVDRTDGVAWLIRDGVVTYGPVLVSTGAEGDEETPTGTYRVEWKNIDHISGESGVPMPFAVFFAPGGIAFHEGSIYTESAGCVRMRRADAQRFYETLAVGDRVEVRGVELH